MRRLNWSERQRWWLLAVAWVVLLVLGVGGFVQQSRDLALGFNFLDHLYLTLQLAALDYKGASTAINWRLQVARFAAPGITAGTLLQSASIVFREQFTRWRSRRSRGHTLVCGLGPVGTRLAEALVADGRRVVAVSADETPGVATIKRLGVSVVVGDPTDPAVLSVVRADRAARVVAVTEHDATNVAVASAVGELPRPAGAAPLRCAVRLLDGELAHLLRASELGRGGSVRLEFFNVHERAAQALLEAHPLDGGDPSADPHLVVLGLGQLGRDLVVTAAQRWAERAARPLRVTLVDRQASGRLHALRMRHPALRRSLDARCIALDIGAPTETAVDEFDAALADHPPTLVVAAFEDDSLAWTSGLFVRRRVTRPVDIVVRTDSDGGFGKHLQGALGERGTFGRIVTFPFLEQACTTDLIEGGVREQLARAIHADHVARAGRGAALHRDWVELSDAERESSRAAADAVVDRIEAIGARLVPLASWDLDREVFTADEVDQLAAAEHARWMDERQAAGWTYGEVRDDIARRNPLVVPWTDLPDEAQGYNRDAARALPAQLARAGFEIAR